MVETEQYHKMVMHEEHASYWIHREVLVEKKKVDALHRVARASGRRTKAKCNYKVLRENITWEHRLAD